MRRERSKPIRRRRRGVALLIVLAALVLVLSATAVLVRAASAAKLNQKIDVSTRIADDLLEAADAPIVDWLTTQAASVVIDPAHPSPQVQILDHRWRMAEHDCELAITAWDQLGMAPIQLARSGSPMRLALPPEALQQLDQLELAPDSKPGLDLLEDAFPQPRRSKAVVFGYSAPVESSTPANLQSNALAASATRLGELVATHNRDPVRINANTAPIELLEAAFRASGRGGIESIVQSRRQGKPASLAAAAANSRAIDDPGHSRLELVSASNLWSFRIDIGIGPVRRSWWATYAPARTRGGQGGWECIQRLAITR